MEREEGTNKGREKQKEVYTARLQGGGNDYLTISTQYMKSVLFVLFKIETLVMHPNWKESKCLRIK